MQSYSLSHVADAVLLSELHLLVGNERSNTALVLAHIAEVDSRKRFLPLAYSSMYDYCVGELRLSEDAAFKRIRAARAARDFPAIYVAVAEGRLHLTAVVRLAPHLTGQNASELLAAATHRTKAGIELLLAQRFPQADVPAQLVAIAPTQSEVTPALASVGTPETSSELGPLLGDSMGPLVPEPVESRVPHPKVAPLSPGRYALQVTLDQQAHDDLAHAQALLAHAVPSGDLAKVIGRALRALVCQMERKREEARSWAAEKRAARAAAEWCESLPENTSIEDRIKFALRGLAPRSARRTLHVAASPASPA